MPELWARDTSGVNRKFRELWGKDTSGVNQKQKELWARDASGVSRKIFSSGIEIGVTTRWRYYNGSSWWGYYQMISGAPFNAIIDSNGITLTADINHQNSETYRYDGEILVSVSQVKYAASTPLVSFNGDVGYSVQESINFDGYQEFYLSGSLSGVVNLLSNLGTSGQTVTGTASVSQSLSGTTEGDHDFRIALSCIVGSYDEVHISTAIPWSAFKWLPTGDELIYNS